MSDLPTVAPGEPTFDVTDVSSERRTWKLSLAPNRLRLDRGDGSPPFDVWRDEFPERLQLVRALGAMYVKLPGGGGKAPAPVPFKLDADVFEAVSAFVGPPTREHLRVELNKRLRSAVPMGLLCLALAFVPVRQGTWDVGGVRIDPFLMGVGVLLAGSGVLSKLTPHRVFFLAEAALFLLFAGHSVRRLAAGGGWFWWVNLVITALLAFSNVRQFFRFGAMRGSDPELTRPPPALPGA